MLPALLVLALIMSGRSMRPVLERPASVDSAPSVHPMLKRPAAATTTPFPDAPGASVASSRSSPQSAPAPSHKRGCVRVADVLGAAARRSPSCKTCQTREARRGKDPSGASYNGNCIRCHKRSKGLDVKQPSGKSAVRRRFTTKVNVSYRCRGPVCREDVQHGRRQVPRYPQASCNGYCAQCFNRLAGRPSAAPRGPPTLGGPPTDALIPGGKHAEYNRTKCSVDFCQKSARRQAGDSQRYCKAMG